MGIKLSFVIVLFAANLLADIDAPVKVHAEGYATSDVAEYVARKLAKSRCFDSARQQCNRKGYEGEPQIIPESGYDTATGKGNHWQAHFFADFYCSDEPAKPVDMGPWANKDETLFFQVLPKRLSWWLADKECNARKMTLPTWKQLATNWKYLIGTTPINTRISEIGGCVSVCPTIVWTSEEKGEDYAYGFSNYKPSTFDDRANPKEWLFPIVCVEAVKP